MLIIPIKMIYLFLTQHKKMLLYLVILIIDKYFYYSIKLFQNNHFNAQYILHKLCV